MPPPPRSPPPALSVDIPARYQQQYQHPQRRQRLDPTHQRRRSSLSPPPHTVTRSQMHRMRSPPPSSLALPPLASSPRPSSSSANGHQHRSHQQQQAYGQQGGPQGGGGASGGAGSQPQGPGGPAPSSPAINPSQHQHHTSHHHHHHMPSQHGHSHNGHGHAQGGAPPPPQTLGGPAMNPPGANGPGPGHHHHHLVHHHHHQGQGPAQGQVQGHHHMHPSLSGPPSHQHHGMGPGVPPQGPGNASSPQPSASANASANGRGGHARTHSAANGFGGPRERDVREIPRERERERNRERGLSTTSVGPPPSSGGTLPPPSTGGSSTGPTPAGPGVVGSVERRVRDREHQQQITFQHHQPPERRERDLVREREGRDRDVQMLPPHHHHIHHTQQPSGLAAVAAAADAISAGASVAPALSSGGAPNGVTVNGTGANGAVAAPGPSARVAAASALGARLGESMDVIRAEYEGLVGELATVRALRDEFEGKVINQVNELAAIRKALYELENAHGRVRDEFEHELARLRAELRAAKQAHAEQQQMQARAQAQAEMAQAGGPSQQQQLLSQAPQPIQLGGPGLMPGGALGGPGMSGRSTPVGVRREREHEREREAGQQSVFYRPRGDERRGSDREMRERDRMDDRERERVQDGRDPKRVRVESVSRSGAGTPGPGGRPGSNAGLREREQHQLYPQPQQQQQQLQRYSQAPPPPPQHGATLGSTPRFPPVPGTVNTGGSAGVDVSMGDVHPPHSRRESTATVDVDMDAVTDAGERKIVTPFPETTDFKLVPAEYKKEGSDWYALFNARKMRAGKKPVDVGLVHNLMHDSVVCCVKFSADGKFLATGSNRSAQIFNTQTGLKICTLVDEAAITGKQGDLYIRSVCFSPCGRWLATGAEDKVVRIWDISKKRIQSVFDGHQQEIYALEFSLDGRLLVSGSGDKTARVWDVGVALGAGEGAGDAAKPTVLTIEDNVKDQMDVDVYGDRDASDDEDESKRDDEDDRGNGDGKRMKQKRGGETDRMDVAGDDGGAGDVDPSMDPGITSIAVSPDGRYVAAGSLDSLLRLWDLRPTSGSAQDANVAPVLIERLIGHKDSVYSVSFTRDGRFLVSASLDKGVRVWDVGHLGIVPAPGLGGSEGPANGKSKAGVRRVKKKSRCVTQFVGHRDFVLSVAVSFDGRWVVSGSKDRGVMWWEVGRDKERDEGSSSSLAMVKRGGESEGEGKEGVVGLGPRDQEAVCVLQGHKNSVISIDLSPVGNMLATGSGDWQARIWTYKTD
ncbi:hypothetical protein D9611_007244 [Ephemerocybe angulata]|uniref:Transcriptional repressor Tup1 N-terminal domain-containing protein n=1 Tax=Ephemerocybe angulata TaxID=980116 RepID=A0A8H5B1J0_9AGAR|nr:hypothetical protein D9611_007244 [Tulosesus angulatus]